MRTRRCAARRESASDGRVYVQPIGDVAKQKAFRQLIDEFIAAATRAAPQALVKDR